MKTGDIVKHKLTGDRMLVLDDNGMGASCTPQTRVRTKDMKEIILDTVELEEELFCVRCGRREGSYNFDGCTGPCVYNLKKI